MVPFPQLLRQERDPFERLFLFGVPLGCSAEAGQGRQSPTSRELGLFSLATPLPSHSLPTPPPRRPPRASRGPRDTLGNGTLGGSLCPLIRGVTRTSVLAESRPTASPAWEDGEEGEGAGEVSTGICRLGARVGHPEPGPRVRHPQVRGGRRGGKAGARPSRPGSPLRCLPARPKPIPLSGCNCSRREWSWTR